MKDWRKFIIENGWRARVGDLSHITGADRSAITSLRGTGTLRRLPKLKPYTELFQLWHGRPPRDDEWPAPRCIGGGYEWQAPELALLASLVGRVGKAEISRLLTERLRRLTGDKRAARDLNAVQMGVGKIGLQTTDVVGGITVKNAAAEIGNGYYVVWAAIQRGDLRSFKVGKIVVIPHDAWAEWKVKIKQPPAGWVQLAKLRQRLGIKSDKLSEYARDGMIPTAQRFNVWGKHGVRTTKYGTWFLDPEVARKLVADRRAGKPMPWWGKPYQGNLRQTWKLLSARRHPDSCETCRKIWGPKGSPRDYSDYVLRYPPLLHGAKRHLTRPYSPGLTFAEVAALTGRSWAGVRLAVNNGLLRATKVGRTRFVTRTDATRWKARKCPTGRDPKSWLSLRGAKAQYGFKLRELKAMIERGELKMRIGTLGAERGITYVLKQQLRERRERIGYTMIEGARRLRISRPTLRMLLTGVDWRGAEGIPLDTLNACKKRLESQNGSTLHDAARKLNKPIAWVRERVLDGTVRVTRARWDRRRLYLTEPMIDRLRRWKPKAKTISRCWLFTTEAELEAGVSIGTIRKWVDRGWLKSRVTRLGHHCFLRRSIRACARRYWRHNRLHRAVPPAWLQAHATPARPLHDHLQRSP